MNRAFAREMQPHNTPWHMVLLAMLAGCSSSHTADCPEIAGSCLTPCCESAGRPTFDEACHPTCPAGTSLGDRCTPGPECGCGDATDASLCWGGPCCDQAMNAVLTSGCVYACPSGYSETCVPDPGAHCDEPWARCESPADCVLAPAGSCCFRCDTLTLEDVIAVNATRQSDYYTSLCPEGVACPPCVPATNPSVQVTCDAGLCEAFDVRRRPLSACESDVDCRVRVMDCCECGADTSPPRLIALNIDEVGAYTALVCDSLAGDCAPCGAVYPDDVVAYCAADGHCDLRAAP